MTLLAIDTSAGISVAVLFDDGRSVEVNTEETRLHAEQLSVLIAQVLSEAGVTTKDLSGIAVGTGPGPFTGLRIGLVAARTLAFALDLPLYGVCSLDALALQTVEDLKLHPGTEILVATDARRKEVYWAQYRNLEPLLGSQVSSPTELPHCEITVGQGAVLYPDVLHLSHGAPTLPSATALGRIALQRAAQNLPQPTDPLYLRRPDIHGQ